MLLMTKKLRLIKFRAQFKLGILSYLEWKIKIFFKFKTLSPS